MSKTIFPHTFLLPILSALALPLLAAGSAGSAVYRDVCVIQGSGLASPYVGDLVETRGVVTFDRDESWEMGFFIQQANCDGDPATSDALFVYTGVQENLVSVGQFVEVSGWVVEFGGMTEISAGPEYIQVLGTAPLPPAVPFSPPWPPGASRLYFEAREGMRISMPNTVVVGPTTVFDQTFVVAAALGVDRILTGMPTGPIVRVDDDGLYEIAPEVRTGQTVLGLAGILDVYDGEFHVRLTAPPVVVPYAAPAAPFSPPTSDLTFASLNLYNLFDTVDDPNTQDPLPDPSQYQTKLQKLARMISEILGEPLFIAVQEAENAAVLQALSNRPEIENQYGHVLIDGPDVRGIDVGLLYRLDRVTVLSVGQRQGCTSLVDGLGPDGNLDVINPSNALTCDLDGQPGFEGNRIFSRPPLLIRLEVCPADCSQGGPGDFYWVIPVHLKSKSQDTAIQYTLPRRLEQAAFLNELTAEILAADPGAAVILIGDFNDVMGSAPIELISGSGMFNLMPGVPYPARYTYIFDGVSQALDYVFISQALASDPLNMFQALPQPFAADFPALLADEAATPLRASDHDPVLVVLHQFDRTFFFPFTGR
ncbi:MAG TPA: endonuclease/exonuclease/phosphatase family protein [Anaerolineales bacterium]|nr:endonuclease/exonuclease/phosphatase family protein [Anaerolineales bacterium]